MPTRLVAHHPYTPFKSMIEHAEQASRLFDVVITRALILVCSPGEFVEKPNLSKHWADRTHLEHHPLDSLVAAGHVFGEELAAFFSEIEENCTGLEQGQRPAQGTIRVDDGWDLVVRAKGLKFRRHLIVEFEPNEMRLVGKADFLKHDRNLDAVRSWQ